MDNLFDRRGIQRIIDAAGTLTRLSGSRIDPEVSAAMAEAASQMVRIDQLQATAGGRLAELTGAEAALVTAGASAGLTLAAAACLAGLDPARMDRLPDTTALPNEIVVPRSHRNGYDHALRLAGARLVEVGVAERTRDPQPWELEAAVTPQTVALAYSVGFSPLPLATVVDVARRHELPVIVDAAATLPPRANLRAFIAAGADLVVFSGGKAIRGPQASGILCGRRDLIASAALQMWDLDVLPELWDPPPALIPREVIARGVPNHGIGRGMKVGKEQIVGLLAALERFVAADEAAENARHTAIATYLAEQLANISAFQAKQVSEPGRWDVVELTFEDSDAGPRALALARYLEQQSPAICVGQGRAPRGQLTLDPFCLQSDEAEFVARAIRAWQARA